MVPIFGAIFLLLIEIGLGSRIPVLQAPDEVNHLSRTLEVATGSFQTQSHPKARKIQGLAYIDINSLLPIAIECQARPCKQDGRPTTTLNHKAERLNRRKLKTFISSNYIPNWNLRHPMLGYTGVNYLPQAIAIKAGLDLNLSALNAYNLARLAQQIAAALIFGYCLKSFLNNDSRVALTGTLIMTLPMMLFLSSSLSGDCLVIEGAILLAIQLETNLMEHNILQQETSRLNTSKNNQDWKQALIIIASFAWLSSKITYLPLAISQALGHAATSWKGSNKKKVRILSALTLVFCSLITILTITWLHYTADTLQHLFSSRLSSEISGQRSWDVLHVNPTFLDAIKTSFLQQGTQFMQQAIGVLGSLDKPLSKPIYYPLIASITFASLAMPLLDDNRNASQGSSKPKPIRLQVIGWAVLLSIATLASCYLIFAAIWMTWSPPGATFVEGIQGRYFLPLLPTVPIITALTREAIANTKHNQCIQTSAKLKSMHKAIKLVLALFGITVNILAYTQTINFWY